MWRCTTLACHWSARLRPFSVASSSTKLICWASFFRRSQYASSKTVPNRSNTTPVAKELASTHAFSSCPDTCHSPWARSLLRTLVYVSAIICLRESSSTISSHPSVTAVVHLFSTPVVAWNHPQTDKCPTNLPQIENVMRRFNTQGNSGTGLSHFYRKVLHSSQTSRPCTRALTGQTEAQSFVSITPERIELINNGRLI